MYQTVFWVGGINEIGGVETFLFEIAKRYKEKDITVMYQVGAPGQIKRLRGLVRTVKWNGKPFECDTLITNFDIRICDYVTAKHYYCVIHADYRLIKGSPPVHEKIDQYIAVSKTAAEGWKEVTGIDAKVCYNPITAEKPKKVLRLISCTRLTADKGGKRMEILANKLTESGIPFLWTVVTNSAPIFKHPNVVFLPSRLDGVRDLIADSDYLVQLSDSEACSYALLEALSLSVPLLVTPFPSAFELGAEEGKTGYILPFDMADIPAEKIYSEIPKFTYTPPNDRWQEWIADRKSTYEGEKGMIYKVKATNEWQKRNVTDATRGHVPKPGEEWEVDEERLEVLTGQNPYGAVFVEVVETMEPIKEEKPKGRGRKKNESK